MREFQGTCQGFYVKLHFNGIFNGRNLAQCFPCMHGLGFRAVLYDIDHYATLSEWTGARSKVRACRKIFLRTLSIALDVFSQVASGAGGK